MSKFKFIQNLLENEKFDLSQKERFFKLVSKELEHSSEVDLKGIKKDIEDIKEKIGFSNLEKQINKDGIGSTQLQVAVNNEVLENKKEEVKEDEVNLPTYKKLINLYNFLKEYNQHPVLKYTCHHIDSNDVIAEINEKCCTTQYDFSNHLKLITSTFDVFKKKHFIDPKIINLILVYLTGESFSKKDKSWSTDKIKYNWSSPELFKWSSENPKIIPNPGLNIKRSQNNNGFKFAGFNSNILDTRIRTFSELVIHFKNLFHLKGDNSLLKIIKIINIKNNWNDKIDFNINKDSFDETDFRENIELFTDVDSLKKGYVDILKLVIESSSIEVKPIINLTFKSENDKIEFSIHHLNSKIIKKSAEDLACRIGESHKNIVKNLNGVCDIYLNAEYSYDQFCSINLWNGEERKVLKLASFKGVEHVLKFK
jgi:hypothetical protein